MSEFEELIQSIKRGDLECFNRNLEKNQRFYIQKGIYLILEKLKRFVYRNLFRKVSGENTHTRTHGQPTCAVHVYHTFLNDVCVSCLCVCLSRLCD